MKISRSLVVIFLMVMLLIACGDKKAGIEGKVIDGRGKPVANVTVIFSQEQQLAGYEHFETKTDADGNFKITGITPAADYIITILSDKWSTTISRKIKTPLSGDNLVLNTPLKIRFRQMKDGSVIDTKTGLQWLIYPAMDITAANVLSAVSEVKSAGFADWRLPVAKEIDELQEQPATPKKTCCVWVKEADTETVAWISYAAEKNELWTSRKESPENRLVVIRNITPAPTAQPATSAP